MTWHRRTRIIYKAYNVRGELASETWTSSPNAEAMERSMYRTLLDRGHYMRVEVIVRGQPTETMRPGTET